MRCADYKRWLSPYVDGRLPASERMQLEEHLASCPACQTDLKALQQMLQSLRTMDSPQTPELLPGIHAKLEKKPLLDLSAWRLPLGGLAVAATAALVLVVSAQVSNRPAPLLLKQQLSQAAQILKPAEPQAVETITRTRAGADEVSNMKDADTQSKFSTVGVSVSAEVWQNAASSPIAEAPKRPAGPPSAYEPIQAEWKPDDRFPVDSAFMIPRMNEWVSAHEGFAISTNEHHLSIKLPAKHVPEFLQKFTTSSNAASPAAYASQPFWVTISLELTSPSS